MGKSILFVDDEIHILKSLKRLFMDLDYTIYLADSGEEALDILKNHPIDLIVTDIRMPIMDGYELLLQVKRNHPRVFRVVLSGYTEDELVVKAIQKNLAKLYIYKPWDGEYLLDVINGIFEFKDSISSPELLNIINNLEGLPTLPDLYTSLCDAIHNDEDIDYIASIIEKDQAVATQILHIANSAFYGLKTSSISQAILNIGLNNIKNIVLATSVFNVNLHESIMKHFRELWEHAALCNQLTSFLYQKVFKKKIPVDYLSTGLLHDIGKIVLLNILGVNYFEILKAENIIESEKNELGITHQHVGGYLLDWWELPMAIIEVALYHHDPMNKSIINKDIISIIHLADYYSWHIIGNSEKVALDETIYTKLGANKDILDQYVFESDFASQFKILNV